MKLLISNDIKLAENIKADGVHFSEYMFKKSKIDWKTIEKSKLKKKWIITGAAHSYQAIKRIQRYKKVDAAILSPVFPTKSHPNEKSLNVKKFSNIVRKTKLPIYALGGINIKNIKFLLETDIIGYAFQRGV
tara:strand:- start:436 stop:831 length:396 start_codon:yes stop_codon:yes gene_type:complete